MELPYFPFYVRDWRADPQLQACSLGARGLWIEMLCIMSMNQTRRGFLEIGGKPIKDAAMLARFVNGDAKEVEKLLSELEFFEVFSRDESGVIFSRRAVKDAAMREQKRAAGKLGGNPSLIKQPVKQVVKHAVKQGCLNTSLNPESRVQSPESIDQKKDVGQLPPHESTAVAVPASQTDEQWITDLKADPAYKGLDVEREYAKMVRYCQENRKPATRRRFINWLNRCDRTLEAKPRGVDRNAGTLNEGVRNDYSKIQNGNF